MRIKPWTDTEIEACPFYAETPSEHRGQWQALFPRKQPVWLEIGCGKGVSTADMAHDNRNVNVIAIDEVRIMLAYAIRGTLETYGEEAPDNIVYSAIDAMRIHDSFSREDGIERVIINFCNPWDERAKHHKRRLTHPRQLLQYREFLAPGGTIHFKTDNDALFTSSVRYMADAGFAIEYLTDDLHASGYAPNYVSEHERKYTQQGKNIHFLIARMEDRDVGSWRDYCRER